jgi:glycolate oxidase FAD binding subunit
VIVRPQSVEEVRDAILGAGAVVPIGAGTKPALSAAPGAAISLCLAGLSGITEYDPAELTFTARAGTTLAEIEAELGEHGQHLPCEPPLRAAGATLGGALAAGCSGPGAFGGGSMRDFVLGIRIVDGEGRLIAGGGRVVKNAAGFDLPKLMVGSCGSLGTIVELTCKVFPRPAAQATLTFRLGSIAVAAEAIASLARGPVRLEALELEPPGLLTARIGGDPALIESRLTRLAGQLEAPSERLDRESERVHWDAVRELSWAAAGSALCWVPITLLEMPALEEALAAADVARRYGLGANVAWIAWPAGREDAELDGLLAALGLRGLQLSGDLDGLPVRGAQRANQFAERGRRALDPNGRFPGTMA